MITYTVLLPLVLFSLPAQGLAMVSTQYQGDLELLGAGWYYRWTWCDSPRCVPMVYSFQLPPHCPPYILAGNEPNARPPYGSTISPQVAAQRTRAIAEMCPQSVIVAGNVSADDWGNGGDGADWLQSFLEAYQGYDQALGVHCYAWDRPDFCMVKLSEMRALYSGDMWATEFNCIWCTPDEFAVMLNYIRFNFSHYAAYTNRQYGLPSDLAGADLVNANGTLAPNGAIYAGD